jgi:tRNA (adenine22-N1)-methyltransferase
MKIIKLSERLKTVASYVRQGDAAADVGTDHGYIPLWLIQSGICDRVIASDINEGPLESARQSAAAYNVCGIDFRLCDGLKGIKQEEADTVIIAGMGGDTIEKIIIEAGWDWTGKRLILQPMSKQAELIYRLYGNGFVITGESFAYEKNDIYRVIQAEYKPAEAIEVPRKAFIHGGFTYGCYAEKQRQRLLKAVEGLETALNTDEEKLKEYREILEDMENAFR